MRARFAAADQAHRAAGEHAAIALEVGVPGPVVDFVGQDLADVDRGRVHRIDQQRDAAGERLAVLLALLLVGLLDMLLERGGALAERQHLLGQAVGRRARRIDGSGRDGLDLAQALLDALADHALERLAVFARTACRRLPG